jgi:hypothetical protein
MNYARYSKEALEKLPPRSAELMRRIVELRTDVMLELHATIAVRFREIVEHLNSLGHTLCEQRDSKPGSIDYAEGKRPNPFYLCCDTVISAGYRGATIHDILPEDEEERSKKLVEDKCEEEWLRSKGIGAEPGASPNGGPRRRSAVRKSRKGRHR